MQNTYELAKAYVEELKNNGIFDELIEEYNQHGSDALNEKVVNLVSPTNKGEISPEEMELVEMKLIVLFAAIKDKVSKVDFVFEQDKDGKNLFVKYIEEKETSSKTK